MPAAAAVAALVTLSTFSMAQWEAFDMRAGAWERQTCSPGAIVAPDSPRWEETIKAVSDVVGPVAREDVHGISHGRWSYRSHAFLAATPGLVESCRPGEPCGPPARVPGPQELFSAFAVVASPPLLDAPSVPTAMPSDAAMFVSGDVEVEEASFQLHRTTGPLGGEPVGNKVDLRISPILPETVTDWMPTPEASGQLGVESDFLGEILIAEDPVTPAMRSDLAALEPNIRMPGVPFRRGPDAKFHDTGIVVLLLVLTVVVALLPSAGRQRLRRCADHAGGFRPGAHREACGGVVHLPVARPPYAGVDWWLILGLAVIGRAAAPGTTSRDDLHC